MECAVAEVKIIICAHEKYSMLVKHILTHRSCIDMNARVPLVPYSCQNAHREHRLNEEKGTIKYEKKRVAQAIVFELRIIIITCIYLIFFNSVSILKSQ